MKENSVTVGIQPWLPRPLSNWSWWTAPVRAERLAALRIGFALVLLFDVLVTYLPYASLLFGRGSLGAPEVFGGRDPFPLWQWSPLAGMAEVWMWQALLVVWAVAALLLLLGVWPRASAAVALLIALAISNPNPLLFNSGDFVRHTILFYLMLTPCGAVWALRRQEPDAAANVCVAPWALRLLFLQLCVIYFLGGMTKIGSPQWHNGEVLHYALASLGWSHVRYPLPFWSLKLMTWFTLAWEIGFPLLVAMRRTRGPALWIGVIFHVITLVVLRIGLFGPYMLCLYLPLVPWEHAGAWFKSRVGTFAECNVTTSAASAG